MPSLRQYQRRLCEIVMQLIQLQKWTKSGQNNLDNCQRLHFPMFKPAKLLGNHAKFKSVQLQCHLCGRTNGGFARSWCSVSSFKKWTKSGQNNFNNNCQRHVRLAFSDVHKFTCQSAWQSFKVQIIPTTLQSMQQCQRRLCEIVMQLIQLQKWTKSGQNNFDNCQRRAVSDVHKLTRQSAWQSCKVQIVPIPMPSLRQD